MATRRIPRYAAKLAAALAAADAMRAAGVEPRGDAWAAYRAGASVAQVVARFAPTGNAQLRTLVGAR